MMRHVDVVDLHSYDVGGKLFTGYENKKERSRMKKLKVIFCMAVMAFSGFTICLLLVVYDLHEEKKK